MISKRVISLQTIALAIVLISFDVGSVAAYDPYHTPDPSPPPPPYEYMSPPPPSPSNSYYYYSPPPPSPSPPSDPIIFPPPPSPSPPPVTSTPPPSPSPPLITSPPLPPPITSPHPPHPSPHRLIVRVVGKVYCYRCYDWKIIFEDSRNKKPLLGATVEVACKAGRKTIKAYGKSKSNGKYNIKVEDFDYLKYGPTVCEAKLHAPPKGSSCDKPTKLTEETDLKVIYQDKYEVVLEAKPFAYAKNEPFEECKKSPPPPYPYISPPPPSPSPSPPPPSPSPPPPSPSSPPIYPYISPPPPYHNK